MRKMMGLILAICAFALFSCSTTKLRVTLEQESHDTRCSKVRSLVNFGKNMKRKKNAGHINEATYISYWHRDWVEIVECMSLVRLSNIHSIINSEGYAELMNSLMKKSSPPSGLIGRNEYINDIYDNVVHFCQCNNLEFDQEAITNFILDASYGVCEEGRNRFTLSLAFLDHSKNSLWPRFMTDAANVRFYTYKKLLSRSEALAVENDGSPDGMMCYGLAQRYFYGYGLEQSYKQYYK